MYGVSPAFILSKYGHNFTVSQFCEALPEISALGFDTYQPEIFIKEELDNWVSGGGKTVNHKADESGLAASQFVAHFLLEGFSSPQKLFSDYGVDELKKVIDVVEHIDNCKTIVIPIGAFQIDKTEKRDIDIYEKLKVRLHEKIRVFHDIVSSSERKFAIEIMPNSIVEGIAGFLELHKLLDSNNFGISLDTGHAWACRELVPLLPLKLKGKIFGLHLCDNDGNINLSLPPGKGTIDWEGFLYNLFLTGYSGSYDIEIVCKPGEIKENYKFGLDWIKKIVEDFSKY